VSRAPAIDTDVPSSARWSDDAFAERHARVRALYRTGDAVDLDEVLAFLRALPEHRRAPVQFQRARDEGRLLLHPRAGVATVDEMAALLVRLQDEGTADILPVNPDTYTRRNSFEDAERGIAKSREEGHSVLNGFPVSAHGVAGFRRLMAATDRPIGTRTNTPTIEFVATIAAAGGSTELACGAICHTMCMEYAVPVATAIDSLQYVYRLVSWLGERGADIQVDQVGTAAAGTICEPSLSIAVPVIDALIAAAQGVACQSLSYPPMHHLLQDVAGLRVQRRLVDHYFERFGHDSSRVFQGCHQWNGPFPPDEARAEAVIALATASAVFGEAQRIMVKTPQEGMGLPTVEANVFGCRTTRQVVDMLRGQSYPDSAALGEEMEIVEKEARLIIDRVLELGDGDPARGAVRGFAAGVIEYPYAVNRENRGKMMLVRDRSGAVRFLDHGDLPFTPDIVEYHRRRVAERSAAEGRDPVQLMIDDLREVRAPIG
jgi:methylaspartate mutase epsilon subunit